jgi:hypothetical protein
MMHSSGSHRDDDAAADSVGSMGSKKHGRRREERGKDGNKGCFPPKSKTANSKNSSASLS